MTTRPPVVAGYLPWNEPTSIDRTPRVTLDPGGSPALTPAAEAGWHRLVFLPGCFDQTLAEVQAGTRTVALMFDHAERQTLTTTADPNLKIWGDDRGLRFAARGRLAETILAQPRRGVSLAAGGVVVGERPGHDGVPVRFIGPGSLLVEISVVADAATPGALVYRPDLAGFVAAKGLDLWTMDTGMGAEWSRIFRAGNHALPPDLWGMTHA